MSKSILVTGSSGLIGSEVATFFHKAGFIVHGIDNNQRAVFFGPQGDTRWSQQRLVETLPHFRHHELDIRDRQGILALVKELKPSGSFTPLRNHLTTGPRQSPSMTSTPMPSAH